MQAGKDFKWITTAMVMVTVWATTTATTRTKNNNNCNCNLLAGSGLRHFLACLTAKFNSCLIFSTTLNSSTQRGEEYSRREGKLKGDGVGEAAVAGAAMKMYGIVRCGYGGFVVCSITLLVANLWIFNLPHAAA